jgi:type IV pilus assembly protein PilY1
MDKISTLRKYLAISLAVAVIVGVTGGQAAQTDLATEPLITPGTSSVKPNMFFILDNSGSMDWDYVPDWLVDDDWCKDSSGKVDGQGGIDCCRKQDGTAMNSNYSCLPTSAGALSDYRGMPPFHNADFNNLYYNPATTYTVPKNYDGSNKTSYSGTTAVPWDGYSVQLTTTLNLLTGFPDVEWCTDATYSNCLRNDNYLLPGSVGGSSYTVMHSTTASGNKGFATGSLTAPTTANRAVGPYYYVMVPGEYCTTKKLTDCAAQTSPSLARPYAARLRWCNNTSLKAVDDTSTTTVTEACQALKNATYKYPRYPTVYLQAGAAATKATGKITISGTPGQSNCSGTGTGKCGFGSSASYCVGKTNVITVTSLKLQGLETLTGAPFVYCSSSGTSSTRLNGLASAIKNQLNNNGFSAAVTNAVLTVTAPTGSTYNNAVLTATISAPSAAAITQVFAGGSDGTATQYSAGSWKRVDIVAGQTFGNIVVDGTIIVNRGNRSDCAAAPNCTYEEELANFANWFAWYRSRMQMMKSSVSLAFQGIDDSYRVGFFTINSPSMATTSTTGLNIDDFTTTQKQNWYARLFAGDPGSGTPLREALSRAGRLFGGEKTSVLTGATDPMQYSCQKNYTILSTDGYWNGNNGYQLGGSAAIGNHDGSLPRPELDGRGDSATLADVAAYYYNTDLRTTNCTGALGGDVCANNVPTTTNDLKQTQHMVTFTIGLGIDGVMQYRSNYKQTAGAGDLPDDFTAVAAGTAPSPATGVCSWQTSGNCNWPQPGADKQENIDDLWHAAVNGHGTYYSARNPNELYSGLTDALTAISASTGGAAAATTSNPNITTGDNFVFSSNYMTVEWTGELVSQNIDVTTGDIQPTINWSAQAQLDSKTPATRTIYTFDASDTDLLKSFEWANLNIASPNTCNPPADEKGCFSSTYIDSTLAQFCAAGVACLSSADKVSASGENLVNYLRGERSYESMSPPWYRVRTHLLGDIVSAEAVYAGRYLYDYGNGYPEKNTARANPTVYAAANDGMLHALNSANGTERWAYIPSMVLPKLHKLANVNYDTNHMYLVDGTPAVGDILVSGTWKTILVGGLAGGGAGYYALDISNQTTPIAKWEFRKKAGCTVVTSPRYSSSGGVTEDCDLGYSYGNPVIGKVGGTWVVLVTSGYNNHLNGGTGVGYLYVLNADTGALIRKIATGVGDTTTPSGLGRINAWADDAMHDNTMDYAYGGDLLGNLWRFNLTSGAVTLLKSFGASKPITARPELGLVTTSTGEEKRVVFVPTGRLLGLTDLGNTDQQSFYAIWDKASGAAPTNIVNTPVSVGGAGRVGTTCESVFDNDANLGWKMDFPSAGERGNTDPTLAFGTLVFSTNKPSAADACNPSGFESWVYNIDYLCGGVVEKQGDPNTHVATHYAGASTRPNVVVLPSGVVKSITRTSGQQLTNNVEEVRIGASGSAVRRVSWRELLD